MQIGVERKQLDEKEDAMSLCFSLTELERASRSSRDIT